MLVAASSVFLWRRRKIWTSKEEKAKRNELLQKARDSLCPPDSNPQMVALDDGSGTARLLTTYYRAKQSEGATAVLIHGFGCTALEFDLLHQRLREETKLNVFAYERILFAETEDGHLPHPRDAIQLARELHHLLQRRNVPPPYLLIGHSYGGIIAQQYCSDFAEKGDVCGVVLVDPAHEFQNERFPTDFAAGFKYVVPFLLHLYSKVAWTGVLQLMDWIDAFNFPPIFLFGKDRHSHRTACAQLYSNGAVWQRVQDELAGCFETFQRLQSQTPSFRKYSWDCLPVALIVAGNRQFAPTLFPKATTQAFIDMHQPYLDENPESSKLFIAGKSDHWIHMQEPEVILDAVRIINQRRGRNKR